MKLWTVRDTKDKIAGNEKKIRKEVDTIIDEIL